MVLCVFPALAQEPSPPKTEPPAYVIPHKPAPCERASVECVRDGIFMDEIVTYKIRNIIYKIPAIYLSSWPSITQIGKIRDLDAEFGGTKIGDYGLSFQFWMPRVRPEEMKSAAFMIPDLMVKERKIRNQGIEPAPDEYPVSVDYAKFAPPDDDRFTLPEQMFKNESETYFYIHKKQADERVEPELNLKRVFWKQHWSNSLRFYNLPNSNIQITMTCSPDAPTDINPGCRSRVYFNNEQLSFYISFPKSKLLEWESIMTSVRDLMTNWRQK
jgi:hypothetical protein